jgi:hypothetical protein
VTQHWVSIDGPFASGATVPYHHFLIAAVLVLCVLHLCDWGRICLVLVQSSFSTAVALTRKVAGSGSTQRR